MRIVVFSDLLPPLYLGGYEIGAGLIVAELKRRGHEILLLSAREYVIQHHAGFQQVRHAKECPSLHDAGLCLFGSLPRFLRRHPLRLAIKVFTTLLARRRYRKAIAAFGPERVLLFNPLGIVAPVLHDLAALARTSGAVVHAYISDAWLAEWPTVNPLQRALGRLSNSDFLGPRLVGKCLSTAICWLGWAPCELPRFDRCFYCSDYIHRLSLPRVWCAAEHAVVPWGLAGLDKVAAPPPDHFDGDAPLTLLYSGQIQPHKGLALLLRALAGCRELHHLVVLGDDTTDYARDCKGLVAELDLGNRVHFLGKKLPAQMLTLLGRLGHVLVAPSIWEEPFSIAVLEGMAVGFPVIAADVGGAGEVLRHGDTGFLFRRGQADELTAVIDRLESDRLMCGRVGARARRYVQQHCTIEAMVDDLLGAVPGAAAALRAA